MNITQHTTPYYTPAKKRQPPVGLVLHNTVTQTLVAPHAQGSWHFEIGRAGDVHQYVYAAADGHDLAWHVRICDEWRPAWMVNRDSRVSEPNSCTVGIEMVSYAGNSVGVGVPVPYTDAQYVAVHELLTVLTGWYGALPIVSHGSMQLDRTDPVSFDYARAGLVWKGDGYRYEEQEDMGVIAELNTQVAALRAEINGLNGVNTELQRQVGDLHAEVGVRTQERDALQVVASAFAPRIAEMEEALRQAVAHAARRPDRVEVLVGDQRYPYVPAAA